MRSLFVSPLRLDAISILDNKFSATFYIVFFVLVFVRNGLHVECVLSPCVWSVNEKN